MLIAYEARVLRKAWGAQAFSLLVLACCRNRLP
jgi:hypothetical protein